MVVVHRFKRTELLIGKEGLKKLYNSKVAVFGIGGVGSFAAEALARAGVGNLVLIDHDDICITNINRQVHAVTGTVGRPKVEVMRNRILDINPDAEVEAIRKFYCAKNAKELLSGCYDYVIDAIDTISSKLDLIIRCDAMDIPIISSMGTGNKMEPMLLKAADIYDTDTCPLARIVRRELRKNNIQALKVIYSTEKPIKQRNSKVCGSISFVPPTAGLLIAGEVVKDLLSGGMMME